MKFLRNAPEGTYDAIIVDSSDPIGEFMLPCIVFLEHSTMESLCYVFGVVYLFCTFWFSASYDITPELNASLFLGYCIPSCSV